MKKIKVYIAGKISATNSVYNKKEWRDIFCKKIEKISNFKIINLDPNKYHSDFDLDRANAELVFGRDCFLIKSSDVVIVNLTDDISVGGSQEMLIAKYYNKPLIGIAPTGGKFVKKEKKTKERIYKNYTHAFVKIPCDVIVENIDEAAKVLPKFFDKKQEVKTLKIIDTYVQKYKEKYLPNDTIWHNL